MRIAQVAPLFESVPPSLYGGSERVVSWLTEELVAMGHEVTLFASGDSRTAAKLVPACTRALWRDTSIRETLPHHVRLAEEVRRRSAEFDLIHFHCDYVHLPMLAGMSTAAITTMHGLIHTPDHVNLFHTFPDARLVAISDSQRKPLPGAAWCGTVHHGMPLELHSYSGDPEKYLLFLGRTSPDKGLERAIEIAKQSRTKLKIAAKIYDEDRTYFITTVQPLIDGELIEFLGEVGGQTKSELLGHASGLLFPIEWQEPFGLVLIEALASGTPVIAWNRGAVPEIIKHGVHGFVVDNIRDAVAAVEDLQHISRAECRAWFELHFSSQVMAQRYLKIYTQEIARRHRQCTSAFPTRTPTTINSPILHSI